MTGAQAKLAVAGVFLAGLVTGAASMRIAELRMEARLLRSPDPLQQVVLWKMDRDLRLTPAQRAEAHAALRDARRRVAEAVRGVAPRFLPIYDDTVARISRTLDARQRARFDAVARERRKLLQAALAAPGVSP